jgi:hypothetical protein
MHVLFLSLLLNIYPISSHLPVTIIGLDLFWSTYSNMLRLYIVQQTKNSLIEELCQGRCFCAWKWKKTALRNMCYFKKLDDGQNPKKGDCVSYSIGAVFSCLCTYDSLTMQVAVFWLCMAWFTAVWFVAVWFSGSYANLRLPQVCNLSYICDGRTTTLQI